jgi:hypothetical protein
MCDVIPRFRFIAPHREERMARRECHAIEVNGHGLPWSHFSVMSVFRPFV